MLHGVPERPQIVQDAKLDSGRLVEGQQVADGFRGAERPDRDGGDERVRAGSVSALVGATCGTNCVIVGSPEKCSTSPGAGRIPLSKARWQP